MQAPFSVAADICTNQALLSRIYEGSALDKISVKDHMVRYQYKDMLFIVDSGFYS